MIIQCIIAYTIRSLQDLEFEIFHHYLVWDIRNLKSDMVHHEDLESHIFLQGLCVLVRVEIIHKSKILTENS